MAQLKPEGAFIVLARAGELVAEGRDIINLGIGQPDFPTAENIVEAAVKALRDGHHGYTPANGIKPLREAVAADIAENRGVAVDPDRVLIVPGGKVTMFFAIIMLGEPGAEIMFPDPGFPVYEAVIRFSGAKAVPIRLYEDRGFSFSAEEVLAQITPATRLIIVNSPANPTGGLVPRAEFDRFVAGLDAHPHVAILSDEIYRRLIYQGERHTSLLEYESIRDRLIVLDGWSKTYAMTGWRIGYGVWPPALYDAALRLAINDHSCVNAPTQYAAIEALTGPQESVARMVAAFDERRQVIVEELNAVPGMRCTTPLGAFYAFPSITGLGRTAAELQEAFLEEAGVASVAGANFGAGGEDYLRFSYADSIEHIREAIARVRTLLAEPAPGRAARDQAPII